MTAIVCAVFAGLSRHGAPTACFFQTVGAHLDHEHLRPRPLIRLVDPDANIFSCPELVSSTVWLGGALKPPPAR